MSTTFIPKTKLIVIPEAKKFPRTNLCRDNRNIDYLLDNRQELAEILLRNDIRGYRDKRFIDSNDCEYTIKTEQWFKRSTKNVLIEFYITYRYWSNLSWTPLEFNLERIDIICSHKWSNLIEKFTSDKRLNLFIDECEKVN